MANMQDTPGAMGHDISPKGMAKNGYPHQMKAHNPAKTLANSSKNATVGGMASYADNSAVASCTDRVQS